MKTKLVTSCFILASLLVPVAAHAADTEPASKRVSTFVKESAITTKVKAKLATEKLSSLAMIKGETDAAGVLSLSGKVKTQEDADKAVLIATAVDGVKSVSSAIQISP